jgi:F0F1-type ATP synthase membrane subunit b/b'
MTLVGKVLVFFVLFVSLILGGLIVADYTTRTHWAAGVKERDDKIQVLTASLRTYQAEAEKATADAASQVKQMQAQLKKVQDDLVVEKQLTFNLTEKVNSATTLTTKSSAVQDSATTEIQKSRADLDKMRATLQTELNKNNELVKQANEEHDKAVAAGIQVKAVQDTNNRLEAQLRQMAEDMTRLKAGPAGGATLAKGTHNPPPENVEGLIDRVEPGGLIQLTIGSDAGLSKGHTLEAYRLSPIPAQSKYLGTVRIVEVTPNSAVAAPVKRMTDTPKPGDHVASKIGN